MPRPTILENTLTSVYHPEHLRMDSPYGVSLMQRVEHPSCYPLQDGAPALGWAGDNRLAMYVCPADDVWILLRLEWDGEYRVVTVSPVGGALNDEVVTQLIRRLQAHDTRRPGGYDPKLDVDAVNDGIKAEAKRQDDDKLENELAPKMKFALQRDIDSKPPAPRRVETVAEKKARKAAV